MMSSNSFPITASHRSLGTGTYTEHGIDIDNDWTTLSSSVEKKQTPTSATSSELAQRTHLQKSVVKTNHQDQQNEFVQLSGLSEADVKMIFTTDNGESSNAVDLCGPLTKSQTSSPTSSICSNYDEDDGGSSDDFGEDEQSQQQHQLQQILLEDEEEEIQFSEPDIYGQVHPVETDTLIATKLQEMADELLKSNRLCPTTDTAANALAAEHRCPDLVSDKFKLVFLRCECFNAQKAAKRYAKYWDKRVELFGPTRAYQALTLESMDVDMRPMEIGAMHIIHRPKGNDPHADERDILYFDSGRLEPTQYTRESGCRAFWYMFHSLLEDEQVQKKGLVCINYAGTMENRNRDPNFSRMCVGSLQGCIPIRLSVFHGCHLSPFFRLAARVFMLLIGERMRRRIVPHFGSSDTVLAQLESKYGIPPSLIPTDMGGTYRLDIHAWLEQRRSAGL